MEGKSMFGGEDFEFSLGHIEFGMFMAHSRKEVQKAVLSDKSELKKNVVLTQKKALIKAMRVVETDQEGCPK